MRNTVYKLIPVDFVDIDHFEGWAEANPYSILPKLPIRLHPEGQFEAMPYPLKRRYANRKSKSCLTSPSFLLPAKLHTLPMQLQKHFRNRQLNPLCFFPTALFPSHCTRTWAAVISMVSCT